jgi:hypothetical protein
VSDTDPETDTNGDGWPNFIGDADTPIYNTTDNWQHPRYNFNASRTDQLGGSLTDPSAPTRRRRPADGFEDLNRTAASKSARERAGRGHQRPEGTALPMVYNSSRVDRDSLPANARFLETDPNASDTSATAQRRRIRHHANGRVDLQLLYSPARRRSSTSPRSRSSCSAWTAPARPRWPAPASPTWPRAR